MYVLPKTSLTVHTVNKINLNQNCNERCHYKSWRQKPDATYKRLVCPARVALSYKSGSANADIRKRTMISQIKYQGVKMKQCQCAVKFKGWMVDFM